MHTKEKKINGNTIISHFKILIVRNMLNDLWKSQFKMLANLNKIRLVIFPNQVPTL